MVTAFLLSGWPILYVSQFGSDSNPGTEKAPFATLERLQQKLKEHPQGATKQGLEVKITGTIRLKKPIEFGPEVSRVIFTGGGTISGGVQLKNWKPTEFNGHKVWSTAVPAGLEFKELWVGKSGERAVRPTLPKTGFSQLAGFVSEADEKGPWDKGQDAAVFQPGALKSSWRNLSDVELVAHHLWVTSRLPIASIDESTRIVRFGKKSVFKLSNDYQGGGSAYVLENVAEALDSPGEWYHDRPSRTLYYMPRPGEKIQGFVAEAPAIPFLLSVKGASGVGFHNLKFNHSEWNYPGRLQCSGGDSAYRLRARRDLQLHYFRGG